MVMMIVLMRMKRMVAPFDSGQDQDGDDDVVADGDGDDDGG